ncbi:Hypothetical_protein [Hexamita inflata]|uniref:Hypothetical_protein n=1 Tax=Hexamita inflata TaxID=28002 RepID=A0AA86NEL3_9EUKA|nr:Hypothetical protein HINF_LOCUS5947 [Hexamita inflata]
MFTQKEEERTTSCKPSLPNFYFVQKTMPESAVFSMDDFIEKFSIDQQFLLRLVVTLARQCFLQSPVEQLTQQAPRFSPNLLKQRLIDQPLIEVPVPTDSIKMIYEQKILLLEVIEEIFAWCAKNQFCIDDLKLQQRLMKTLFHLLMHICTICVHSRDIYSSKLKSVAFRVIILYFGIVSQTPNDQLTAQMGRFFRTLTSHPLTQSLAFSLQQKYQLMSIPKIRDEISKIQTEQLIQFLEAFDQEEIQVQDSLTALTKMLKPKREQNKLQQGVEVLNVELKQFLSNHFQKAFNQNILIDFDAANDFGVKYVRTCLQLSLKQSGVDQLTKIDKYKPQPGSIFELMLSFGPQQQQEHLACISVELTAILLFKAQNPQARIYTLLNGIFRDLNLFSKEFDPTINQKTKQLVTFCYELIKADCVFGQSLEQHFRDKFVTVQQLIMSLKPNIKFYEALVDIAVASRKFEIPALL